MSYQRFAKERPLVLGGFLVSNSLTFQVQSILGEGAFAKVYKCVRFGGTTPVAIKVLKKTHHCHEDAKAEVRADSFLWPQHPDLSDRKYVFPQLKNLAKLKILDHDKCNIIRVHGFFFARGYHCMVFEHLDRSLGDLMRELPFSRLHLNQIRLIVWQVSTTILCLVTINVT